MIGIAFANNQKEKIEIRKRAMWLAHHRGSIIPELRDFEIATRFVNPTCVCYKIPMNDDRLLEKIENHVNDCILDEFSQLGHSPDLVQEIWVQSAINKLSNN